MHATLFSKTYESIYEHDVVHERYASNVDGRVNVRILWCMINKGRRCSVYIKGSDLDMLDELYPDLGLGPKISRLINDKSNGIQQGIQRNTPIDNDDVLERIEALEMWKADMDMLG